MKGKTSTRTLKDAAKKGCSPIANNERSRRIDCNSSPFLITCHNLSLGFAL